MSDDAASELDRLLQAALDGKLNDVDAIKLRDAVTQLRGRVRGDGSLQTRHLRTVTQLRRARSALDDIRDLADRCERAGGDVSMHTPTMLYVLRMLADQGDPPRSAGAPDIHGCPFCDIVAGRGPAEVLQEWPDTLVIKPLHPVTEGHVLVIPRSHVTDLSDDPVITGVTMRHAARYAATVPDALNLITSRGAAATQSVFHLHLHLVPRRWNDGLALPWHSGRLPAWMARAVAHRERHELGTPMSESEVANALNCSRGFVKNLVRLGELSPHLVNDAEVFFDTEVLSYRERDDAQRRQASDELTRLGQEMTDPDVGVP